MFPAETKIGEIAARLAENRSVVLTAPPGSGKTTCVAPALLNEPWLEGRKIVMLEPRRIAARTCAAYIARRRGEAVGGTVGYQVRLERRVSSATRLEIVTEGLLAQRLLADPELADTGLVIFDEFHERSLPCDLAFALALEVRRALRPDLRILVMSATLDADEVAAHLGDASVVRAEGRMFPVETKYLGDGCPMSAAVAQALKETDGDVLCFLPGEGEIRRAAAALDSKVFKNVRICQLYGALPKEEQDRAFERTDCRKVILATSIAETSVTIEGVTAVVDSGLMRVPRFSPATGMDGLVTLPLTRDRAEQRRGRAGRVRAGVCYRLWSEANDASRPAKAMPEILDADLASLVLTSLSWGACGRTDLPWLTPPPASAWDQSVGLLKRLGAIGADGRLTAKGERMAKLAMHPRLANMILAEGGKVEKWKGGEVERWKGGEVAALLAAIVEERPKTRETDIRKILDYVRETPNRPDSRRIIQLAKRFSNQEISNFKFQIADCQTRPLTSDLQPPTSDLNLNLRPPTSTSISTSSLQPPTFSEGALLALAYPDRVAKNRGNGSFRMVSGRGAFMDPTDALARAPYVVCCELDDRAGDAKVFLASPIDEEEIEELFADQIVEEPYCEWDRANERVKSVVRRKLGNLTLCERQEVKVEGEGERRIAEALVEGVRQKGVANLPCWTKESLQLRARVRFLHRVIGGQGTDRPTAGDGSAVMFGGQGTDRPTAGDGSAVGRAAPCAPQGWPELTDEEILAALPAFVSGMTKWRDLEKLDLFAVIDCILANPQPANSETPNLRNSETLQLRPSPHDRRELDRLAPTRMEVPSGSHMLIRYEGDEPTVEVRLQECFGLMETPKVAGGRVPIVMTLLSPAQRPIQVTKDLAGFWRGAYQLVRKDMRGRYPKHNWPEDPLTAVASRRTVKPRH